MTGTLHGVIAAVPTPVDAGGEPDAARFVAHAAELLDNGCNALNVLGTTGEATSFSIEQRFAVMDAAAKALPVGRLMVGTGSASLLDAVRLTRHAAERGFAGALLLPPFYYKPVSDDGILAFVGHVVEATAPSPIPLYLYNFPALSGVAYTPHLVDVLINRFGNRIAGLKDSSGNETYAREIAALSPDIAVFPSNEANLRFAGDSGPFAGCISATVSLNAVDCAAAYVRRDSAALARAVAVRKAFVDLPLIPGIKAMVAHLRQDPGYAAPLAPLVPLSVDQWSTLLSRYEATQLQELAL